MTNGDAANHWRAIEEEKLRKRIKELEAENALEKKRNRELEAENLSFARECNLVADEKKELEFKERDFDWMNELRHKAEARIKELEQRLVVEEAHSEKYMAENARLRDVIDDMATDPMGEYYTGLRCGVEDRDIMCRYEAAEYGWEQAFEYIGSIATGALLGGVDE